jgi:glycosyltransferase involved in cell wall biosynthesis
MYFKTSTKEKPKVLLIGSIPPPYHGSVIYFQKLLNSELKENHSFIHLDTSDHRNLDNLGKLDFENVYIALRNIISLFFILLKKKPHLVYLSPASSLWPFLRDSLFIVITNIISNAKIIIHMHGGTYFRDVFYQESSFLFKTYIKWTLNKVDIAIVVGWNLKGIIEGLVKRIYPVWNGTEIYQIKEGQHCSVKKRDKIVVGYLGNLFRSKGIIDILNSVELIVEKHRNVIFRFAGVWSGQEHNTQILAHRIIEEKKIEKYIDFCGLLLGEDKRIFLLETDIFIFPTWFEFESFPAVNIEAMAAYCPVISTKDIGAIPEVVIDGVTGILVEKQNVQQIAEAILKLIEDANLRIAMGRAGRERVEKYFSWDIHIKRISEIFDIALNHKIL